MTLPPISIPLFLPFFLGSDNAHRYAGEPPYLQAPAVVIGN